MSKFSIGGYIDAILNESFDNPYAYHSDEYWMFQALIESMQEVGKSSPNPTVGCVYVKNNHLVTKGATQEFGSLHGERYAASKVAKEELEGATAFVTLEPCAHYGSQPPCAELLVDLKVNRVVIAMVDPFSEVQGKGIEILKNSGIDVTLGVLEDECRLWHLPFLLHLKKKMPLMIGKWAQTLDGNLADDFGKSKWISGKQSRLYTHFLRQKYDIILVGAGTVISDSPSLNVRDCNLNINRHPVKAIFDPSSRLTNISKTEEESLGTTTFNENSSLIYIGSKNTFDSLIKRYSKVKIELIEWEKEFSIVDLPKELNIAYKRLLSKELQSIFVEGGPMMHRVFMEADMYDILHTFINPSLVGAQSNKISKTTSKEKNSMSDKTEFALLGTYKLGNDVLIDSIKKS